MFDVGLSELALIFFVTLIAVGPKGMASLASKVGRWVGKARSMARDFQTQLENEVNLEELQKLTESQTRAANQGLPEPPAGFNGEPAPETPAESIPTYPYSAAEEPAASSAADPATADTYSHAHAEGAAPIPYEEPAAEAPAAESVVAEASVPTQADLDLSPAEDESHLPPDDARRYS